MKGMVDDSVVTKYKLTHLGSWTHVRCYLIKVLSQGKNPNAKNMVELIAGLYGIEKQIRENEYKPDKIQIIREKQSILTLN